MQWVFEGWEHLGVSEGTPCADPNVAVGPLLLVTSASSISHPLQDSCTSQACFKESLC